jgi:hypothetical protein
MKTIWDQDAALWGLTRGQALVLAAIPIVLVAGMVASVPFFSFFQWIIEEDSLIEWLQFASVLAASLIYAWLGVRLLRRGQRLAGLLCFLPAAGMFFVAGEEIAWGQRIFGWATPEALETINSQQETTLHNVSGLHALFVDAVMLGGLVACLLPMAWWAIRRQRVRSLFSYLVVPPLCLIPAFVMAFAYRFVRLIVPLDRLYPRLAYPITKFSEVTELCLYFGMAVFAWLTLRQLSQKPLPSLAAGLPPTAPAEGTGAKSQTGHPPLVP